ncbi:MAG: aminotransferase class III-fold pyridoxal phosphate-dependent enzyme [Candidatus Aminicenantes bacterium]|nr:aminotransferase class III-fold pyridoxal phosphate-dependent enzyme [Candidatus Aminicenantes bacterium]
MRTTPSGLDRLMTELDRRYRRRTRRSWEVHRRAEKLMVGGGSHNLRLFSPYPFCVIKAKGPTVIDLDRNSYIDYWQGHYANILGHNPAVIQREMVRHHRQDSLHTGFEGRDQVELAEKLLRLLGWRDCRVRFTTSGTLATMYTVMLSMAATGRDRVLKIGGGWHGASPFLLKGIKYHSPGGFTRTDSAGIPPEILRKTLITRFNDEDDLARILKKEGDRIACFILEPFIGVGGFFAADPSYLRLARTLTEKYGIMLIFDEIISGFRFCPSGVQKLYGIQPDLSTFGKVIGGGHAVSAVVGRREILEKCRSRQAAEDRVFFEGGTFSAHSEYMKAGGVMLDYLARNAGRVYPRLSRSGAELRREITRVFEEQGIDVLCTGQGNGVVPDGSLFMVHFPRKKIDRLTPEKLWDPKYSDFRLKEEVLRLALAAEGVHVVHGGGAISLAHQKRDLDETVAAYGRIARLFKKYLY